MAIPGDDSRLLGDITIWARLFAGGSSVHGGECDSFPLGKPKEYSVVETGYWLSHAAAD